MKQIAYINKHLAIITVLVIAIGVAMAAYIIERPAAPSYYYGGGDLPVTAALSKTEPQ